MATANQSGFQHLGSECGGDRLWVSHPGKHAEQWRRHQGHHRILCGPVAWVHVGHLDLEDIYIHLPIIHCCTLEFVQTGGMPGCLFSNMVQICRSRFISIGVSCKKLIFWLWPQGSFDEFLMGPVQWGYTLQALLCTLPLGRDGRPWAALEAPAAEILGETSGADWQLGHRKGGTGFPQNQSVLDFWHFFDIFWHCFKLLDSSHL